MRDGNPEVLLRLEHLFDVDEHTQWSQDVTLTLSTMFADDVAFELGSVEEMALGGNVELSALSRLHWETEAYTGHPDTHPMARDFDGDNVDLMPQQIR